VFVIAGVDGREVDLVVVVMLIDMAIQGHGYVRVSGMTDLLRLGSGCKDRFDAAYIVVKCSPSLKKVMNRRYRENSS
jgi:hypothetical protein